MDSKQELLKEILGKYKNLSALFVLIQKEEAEERTSGGIYLPDKSRDANHRSSVTGFIVKIGDMPLDSIIEPSNREVVELFRSLYSVGDRVVFKPNDPVYFKYKHYPELWYLHIGDILGKIEG